MIILLLSGQLRCLACKRDDWTPHYEGVMPAGCSYCQVEADGLTRTRYGSRAKEGSGG